MTETVGQRPTWGAGGVGGGVMAADGALVCELSDGVLCGSQPPGVEFQVPPCASGRLIYRPEAL